MQEVNSRLNRPHAGSREGIRRRSKNAGTPRRTSMPRGRDRRSPVRRRRTYRWPGCVLLLLILLTLVCIGGGATLVILTLQPPTNILVLGLDRRPGEGATTRSDTMLLLHVEGQKRQLVLLSIPRDLWVTIPGQGKGRINSAHMYGEMQRPGGGVALAAETVDYNLNVPVDHTLKMDFNAFQEMIDAAGGIQVHVPVTILDEAYPTADYGTMRIEIPAGVQHMDGERALQYARSRHSGSDFDRVARQQQIVVALFTKMTRPAGILRIPFVYRAFRRTVETDLSLIDLMALALAWQRVGSTGLERVVIDHTLTTPYYTPQGAAVLLPRWELIYSLVEAKLGSP